MRSPDLCVLAVCSRSFRDYGDTRCRFGHDDGLAYATVRSLTLLQCLSPAYPAERLWSGRRVVTVEATLNGVDFTRSIAASSFTYYDLSGVRISYLSPAGGPVRGDTRVTVHGTAFEGHGQRGVKGSLPHASPMRVGPSDFASCVWWRPNATCLAGFDCRSDCVRPGACATKVRATLLSRQEIVCLSPPVHLTSTSLTNGSLAEGEAPGEEPAYDASYSVDVSFDDHAYTALNASWHYYEPTSFGISHVDPLGGPNAGGTAVLVVGGGFHELGSARFSSGPSAGGSLRLRQVLATATSAEGDPAAAVGTRTGTGTGAGTDDGQGEGGVNNASQAAGSSDGTGPMLSASTYCLFGADPLEGNRTTRSLATVLSPTRLLCRAPPFHGALSYHRMAVPMFVTLNGDDWARTLPCADCNFTYCTRAGRVGARAPTPRPHGM